MPCSNHTKEYHNFNCHSKVKGYFSKNRITEDGEKSLEKAKQALINKGMYDDAYKDIFYFLAGAFTESHAISIIGKIPSCMHINYLLNTEFESTYQNVDKTKFEIFKEFTDIFFSDYNSKYNTCSPYMKYLENDDFYKMKTLYTLYDQYEKFTNDIKPNNNTLCFYLSILRDNYYLLLNKYDGKEHNDELLDKLKMFKELLRTEVLKTNGKCLEAIENFKEPTKYSEIKRKEEEQQQLRAQEAARAEQERARAEQERARAEQERARAEQEQARAEQELQVPQIPQDELRGRLFIQPPYADTKLPERFRSGEIQTHVIDSQLYELEDTRVTPQSGEGIIHSIKGTFNSIVEIVEPAPILGVSGGMGVLFIILKYTPVGTMFRGRGNRRRIPGSFGGEYPGFMPSFQGHEYGYFPYDQINIAYGPE